MSLGRPVTSSRHITFTTNLDTLNPIAVNTDSQGNATTFTAPDHAGTVAITATDGALVGTTYLVIQDAPLPAIYLPLILRSVTPAR